MNRNSQLLKGMMGMVMIVDCIFSIYIINSGFLFVVCVFCPFVNSFLNGHNLGCDWNF